MNDVVKKYMERRDARLKARMDEFNENDHPRDENGRFTSGGGGEAAAQPKKTAGASPKKSASGEGKNGAGSNSEATNEYIRKVANVGKDLAKDYIVDAMEDKRFNEEDVDSIVNSYCEYNKYSKKRTEDFKESCKSALKKKQGARKEYTDELLGKVPGYESKGDFIKDMKKARNWEPMNTEAIKKVFNSYCEYNKIYGTRKSQLYKDIGGDKR